jgi:hypothetical protein
MLHRPPNEPSPLLRWIPPQLCQLVQTQTDADRALAAGAHEGVLKGSGRMIVGSVSAELYRRIEEHVRRKAGVPDPSRPDSALGDKHDRANNVPCVGE